MKKVLFVMNTMGGGGAEKCLLKLLACMQKQQEIELSLYTILPWGELFGQLPEGVRVCNQQTHLESVMTSQAKKHFFKQTVKAFFSGANGIRNMGFMFRMLLFQMKHHQIEPKKIVWKLLSDYAEVPEETYDIAVAYLQGAATYYVADHVKAAKKVAFIHNEFVKSGNSPVLAKPFYEKFDRIYTVSEIIRKEFIGLFPALKERTKVFYNIIDEQEICSKAENAMDVKLKPLFEKTDGQPYIFLTAARLYKVKAYDIAIEAVAIVKKRGYAIRHVILGEGEERKNLEQMIQREHLEKEVFLPGAVDNPYPYMKACDCYMQATHYEGCCTAISEAVVLHKPVLASDCAGNKEQLQRYQTGHLIMLDAQHLAEGMIYMIKNGNKTIEKANVCISPEQMIADMLA